MNSDQLFQAFVPIKDRAIKLAKNGQIDEAVKLVQEFGANASCTDPHYQASLLKLWTGRFQRMRVTGPGVYELIAAPEGVPDLATAGPDGLYCSTYADGQLHKLTCRKAGKDWEWVTLDHKRPSGKRESTSEAQEFLTSGQVEEYAGRFEHGPYWPGLTFGDWARQAIEQVREAARTGQNVEFIRGHEL